MGQAGAAQPLRAPRPWRRWAGALAVAAGLAAWAAVTDPFSAGADAVSALAIGLVVVAGVVRWRTRSLAPIGVPPRPAGRWWPWLALLTVAVAWELVSFFLGPRVDHPTISSLYDSATRWRAVRGALFLAWVTLGAWLVRW